MLMLPAFYYKGNTDSSSILALSKTTNIYDSEIEKTQKDIKELTAILDSINDFEKDLGLNIQDRIPGYNRIHLFDKYAFKKIVKQLNARVGSKGFTRPVYREVLVEVTQDFLSNNRLNGNIPEASILIRRITHELIHLISYIEVYVNSEGLADYSRYGFWNTQNDTFKLFNEAITELVTFYLIKNYWVSSSVLNKYSDCIRENLQVSYSVPTVMVDMLIDKIAEKLKKSYKEVLLELHKNQLENSLNGTKLLRTTLCKKEINTLANLNLKEIESIGYYLELEPLYNKLGLKKQLNILKQDPGYWFIEKL